MPRFPMFLMHSRSIRTALILALLLGCDGTVPNGGTSGLPAPGLVNVRTDVSASRETTLSEDGGSLTVIGANGVVYTLSVPEFALTEETRIGMYPVVGVSTLPAGAQVAGGVHFVPDGLTFEIGATLTMEFPAGTDLLSLFAVGYDADGADPALKISRADARTLKMSVQHFSGTLAVTGAEALAALGFDPDFPPASYIDRIARASQGFAGNDPAGTAAVLPIYIEWYEDLVRPELVFAGTNTLDSGIFDGARIAYEEWRSVAAMTGILGELSAQVSDATPLAAAYLNRRYEFFNRVCFANPDSSVTASFGPVASAASALEVNGLARQWGVPLEQNDLDLEFLLDNLCVQVVFDTLLADDLDRPGDAGGLTVGTHYTIAGGQARNDLPIRVRLTRGSSAIGTPSSGRVDSAGFFESDITWPSDVDPLRIGVFAQLDRSGFRRISRFDQLTVACTPPQVNAITPSIVGDHASGVFIAQTTGAPTSYFWGFGGGATPNTSTETEPAVTFGFAGTYEVSLTVGNDCGTSTEFFTYEVRALPLTSREFVGSLTEVNTFFGRRACEGPGRASFEFLTFSGFPEFQIEYDFDCPLENRAPGTIIFFRFDNADVTETGFVTEDGFGTGTFVDGFLSFVYVRSTLTVTFEGVILP